MSDIVDQAETYLDLAMQESLRNAKAAVLADTGACHYCDEKLSDGRRWCNTDCRDDYEKEASAKRRNLGKR